MRTNILRITRLFGKTFRLTIVFLFVLGAVLEGVTRLNAFQSLLTPPKMGSRHYQLGHKLALLDEDVEQNGPVDCIIVGSSMVDVGFDPEFFQKGYQEISGQDIRCFNFGIDASSAASTAALAKILVEDYHPSLLLIGTDARDYAIPPTDQDPAVILGTPWVQFRQGQFSLDGWLTQESYLYRYRQHLSRILHFNFGNTLWSETKLNLPILDNGHTRIETVADYINDPPDPQDDAFEVVYYSRIFRPYQLLDTNLESLESIMDYNESGTQVMVVEMPVSDGLYYFFGNGEADYAVFVSGVDTRADLHKVPFVRTEHLDLIPDDGWSDYSHLNVNGAEIFSTWLGREIASMDIP